MYLLLKGLEEEKIAHQRSSRKQIYMNLCANVIKKIRSMPNHEVLSPQDNAPTLSPMTAGQPTVQGKVSNFSFFCLTMVLFLYFEFSP